MKKRNKSVQNI